MCNVGDEVGIKIGPSEEAKLASGSKLHSVELEELLPIGRTLSGWAEVRNCHVGFVGYGKTAPGNKILIAVDREYEPEVPEVIARALREKGSRVDILRVDLGQADREFDFLDEVRVAMRREPWEKNPRRWEGIPFVEDFAARRGYDLLIHGKGGPIPRTEFRYEQIPWLRAEHLRQQATTYPRDLHLLINRKTWEPIWEKARGGKAHLTDAEGTDISWPYWDEYYNAGLHAFSANPIYGHLFAHPEPPVIPNGDASGVVAGTTSHFSRAFPQVKVEIEAGQVVKIIGGGNYGAAWRDLLQESKNIQYPCFPRPGLFYFWEAAIGTNPKISRPSRIDLHSSGGFEWERRRSGVIHMGFGTFWRSREERWAGERGLLYGHLHIHLLFPTLTVSDRNGREYTVIRNGRLCALDDPEVRSFAEQFGDPDDLLREDWIPEVPGINAPGSYEDYARDPGRSIYRRSE